MNDRRSSSSTTIDAFDADAVIFAAQRHPDLGLPVRRLFDDADADGSAHAGIGSVLLLSEVMTKPTRDGRTAELVDLARLLVKLDLIETSNFIARTSVELGAKYGLKAADAIHLATAVDAGADRFITNNRRDFPTSIDEIDITYPDDF